MNGPWLFRIGPIAFSHRFRWAKKYSFRTDEVNDAIREDWIALGFLRLRTAVHQRELDVLEENATALLSDHRSGEQNSPEQESVETTRAGVS